MNKKKVILGISGGIDSSISLFLLLKQGYEVECINLKFWKHEDKDNVSYEIIDKLCSFFNVKCSILDVSEKFKKEVVEKYFLNEYINGGVPNPCIYCNNYIKIQFLLDYMFKNDADYIATGHYAKIAFKNGYFDLIKAKDNIKDQTYFLYNLDQQKLSRLIFPLGDFLKKDIFKIAQENNLNFLSKVSESQNLCFVSNNNLSSFLESNIGAKIGDIKIYNTNQIVGKHNGYFNFAIGQRKKLTNLKVPTNSGPYYVYNTDKFTNTVFVTNNKDDLYSNEIYLENLHIINPNNLTLIYNKTLQSKTRSTSKYIDTQVFFLKNKYHIKFKEPVFAITKGQHIVFYYNDLVIGGAKI